MSIKVEGILVIPIETEVGENFPSELRDDLTSVLRLAGIKCTGEMWVLAGAESVTDMVAILRRQHGDEVSNDG